MGRKESSRTKQNHFFMNIYDFWNYFAYFSVYLHGNFDVTINKFYEYSRLLKCFVAFTPLFNWWGLGNIK